jgi:hypothetical protein
MTIHCKGATTVGQRKCNATVCNGEAITHFIVDYHLQLTNTRRNVDHFYTKPLAKSIFRYHHVYNYVRLMLHGIIAL